jgi:hypothetical protein
MIFELWNTNEITKFKYYNEIRRSETEVIAMYVSCGQQYGWYLK